MRWFVGTHLVALVIVTVGGCHAPCPGAHGRAVDVTPADLSNPLSVAWLTVLANPYIIWLQYAGSPTAAFDDPICPVILADDGRTTVAGGCTDTTGTTWTGTLTVDGTVGSESGWAVHYDAWSALRVGSCADGTAVDLFSVIDGDIAVEVPSPGGRYDFHVDADASRETLDAGSCRVATDDTRIAFDGSLTPLGMSPSAPSGSWSGTTCIETTSWGAAAVYTRNMRWDETRCAEEPLHGHETLRAGDHVARIFFDGEDDCSDATVVTWSLDGVPQGDLQLGCSIYRFGRIPDGGPAQVLAAVAILLILRRALRTSSIVPRDRSAASAGAGGRIT